MELWSYTSSYCGGGRGRRHLRRDTHEGLRLQRQNNRKRLKARYNIKPLFTKEINFPPKKKPLCGPQRSTTATLNVHEPFLDRGCGWGENQVAMCKCLLGSEFATAERCHGALLQSATTERSCSALVGALGYVTYPSTVFRSDFIVDYFLRRYGSTVVTLQSISTL